MRHTQWMTALGIVLAGYPAPFSALAWQQLPDEQADERQDEDEGILFESTDEEELPFLFGDPGQEGQPPLFGDPGASGARPGEPANGDLVTVAFNNQPIEGMLAQIAMWAGKPVIPSQTIGARSITIINEQPVPREEALQLVFMALHEAGIGVVDRGAYIALVAIPEINRGDAPMLGPDDDVLALKNRGMIAEKVYQIRYGKARNIVDLLRQEQALPTDAKIAVDEASNQLVVLYNIGTLQRIQRLIDELDVQARELVLETFRMRYADARIVAQLIVDIYSAEEDGQGGLFGNQNDNIFRPVRGGRQPSGTNQGVVTTAKLRVTVNQQHNSITVMAEPSVMEQIKEQVAKEWDVPIPMTDVSTRIIDLKNSDAVKMRDLLRGMFAQSGEEVLSVTFEGGPFQGGGATRRGGAGGATDQEDVKLHPLAGQFQFQADPAKNRLIVTARTPEHFPFVMDLIKQLDSPGDPTLPELIELKHADAWELAEQLNAILAESGITQEIERGQRGLTPGGIETVDQQQDTTTTGTTEGEQVGFWWQQQRVEEEERPLSNLIGQARIVPIARQNALLVMSPPEFRESIRRMVSELDRPGRQVLIAATIFEVTLEDNLELGVRWGQEGIFDSAFPDNEVRFTTNFEGTENDVLPDLFDTSVLGVNFDVNAAIEALKRITDVNVIESPRVFTSDNQEAIFFDGQDVPFVTNTQVTDTGNTIQSFEYRAVGLRLAARPHITTDGNVDMLINLELSSVVPGQTLFGGFILDRRETETKVTIKNGQTIVLSGIFRNQDSEILRKVPLLGDIPLLGALFRSKTRTEQKTELVAFITPIVLDPISGEDNLTKRDREMFHQANERTPSPLEEYIVPTDVLPPGAGEGASPTEEAPVGEPAGSLSEEVDEE